MKYTITIDCDDQGKYHVWTQEKESMTKEDIDTKRVLEAKVKEVVRKREETVGQIKWPDPREEAAF